MREFLQPIAAYACLAVAASPAAAQVDVSYREEVTIKKDLNEVYAALMSYGQWCEKGCRYKSPGVKVDERLNHESTPARFYTWTWISDVKDTKYFSEISVQKSSAAATIVSRALTASEKVQIAKLEKVTGRKQDALFDTSKNTVRLSIARDAQGQIIGTQVDYDTRLQVSGFLAMFPGKLRKGLKDSTHAVFAALRN